MKAVHLSVYVGKFMVLNIKRELRRDEQAEAAHKMRMSEYNVVEVKNLRVSNSREWECSSS